MPRLTAKKLPGYCKRAFSASLAMLLLAGCSNTQIGGADRQINAADSNAVEAMFKAELPMKPSRTGQVDESDGIWTGGHATRQDHGDPLPVRWETSGVTLSRSSNVLTLREFAAKITEGTGIAVVFSPDINPAVFGGSGGNANGGQAGRGAGGATQSQGQVGQALGELGVNGAPVGDESSGSLHETFGDGQRVTLSFRSGPLDRLLNEGFTFWGLSWRYSDENGGVIHVSRNVMRTFYINALPLKAVELSGDLSQVLNSAASGSSGQTTSSSSGTSSLKTQVDLSIRIWDEIVSGVQAIIDEDGSSGHVSPEPSTGTLSVMAPSQTMDRIQSYLERQNAILSKTVVINVDVISLQLQASDSISLKLNGLLNKANQFALDYGTGGASELAAAADAGQAVLGKITSAGSSNGTEFLLQNLSTLGNAEVTSHASATTLNGLPVPISLAQTRGYLAEVQTMVTSTSSASASNSQTTMTPGSVTVGLNIRALPQVLPDNRRVRLHITAALSDLHGSKNGFDEFSTGNQTIQLPNIISRNVQQDATIPSGRTIYLSGLEQTSTTLNKSGTGTPSMLGLGGSQNGQRARTMFIIAVTPSILTQDVIEYMDDSH